MTKYALMLAMLVSVVSASSENHSADAATEASATEEVVSDENAAPTEEKASS